MEHSIDFFRSILNSITDHIVIIDQHGKIKFVNAAWINFGTANDSRITDDWKGVSYLNVCDTSTAEDKEHGRLVAAGIRKIIDTRSGVFYHEYPCHSSFEKRWFMMRVTPLQWAGRPCFIISHQNITERKLAEDAVIALSLMDGLTGVANRRHFDEFLNKEWRVATRMNTPLSLILLDVDHFKLYNDQYGHQKGDDCLQRISAALVSEVSRSSDLCARYGGEEFALILGNTDADASEIKAHKLLQSIRNLEIAHLGSVTSAIVTASLGVATIYPRKNVSENKLINLADQALYVAKNNGRNKVTVSEYSEPVKSTTYKPSTV